MKLVLENVGDGGSGGFFHYCRRASACSLPALNLEVVQRYAKNTKQIEWIYLARFGW